MAGDRKWYCPSCGTRITLKERDYLNVAIAHGLIKPCLTNPDCDGEGQ